MVQGVNVIYEDIELPFGYMLVFVLWKKHFVQKVSCFRDEKTCNQDDVRITLQMTGSVSAIYKV